MIDDTVLTDDQIFTLGAETDLISVDPKIDVLMFSRDEFLAAGRAIEAAVLQSMDSILLKLLLEIRYASGDNGLRMQPELVEYIRELKRDADRYRKLVDAWLEGRSGCEFLLMNELPPENYESKADIDMAVDKDQKT